MTTVDLSHFLNFTVENEVPSGVVIGGDVYSERRIIIRSGNTTATTTVDYNIPRWATSFSYMLVGGGAGGTDGDGAWGGNGRGGRSGEAIVGYRAIRTSHTTLQVKLGYGGVRGSAGTDSTITHAGMVIRAAGGFGQVSRQNGDYVRISETHENVPESDMWLDRLAITRNNSAGLDRPVIYQLTGGGIGNAGPGQNGGGGAGGNGGIFGNYTPGGRGGGGYVKLVFYGIDRYEDARLDEMSHRPGGMLFASDFNYNSNGRIGQHLPKSDLRSVESFRIHNHSEYVEYLDDYTYKVKKSAIYAMESYSHIEHLGAPFFVSEMLIEIIPESGPTRSFRERDTHRISRQTRLNVGDIVRMSVVRNNGGISNLETVIRYIQD